MFHREETMIVQHLFLGFVFLAAIKFVRRRCTVIHYLLKKSYYKKRIAKNNLGSKKLVKNATLQLNPGRHKHSTK
jgi:hypothetical protein